MKKQLFPLASKLSTKGFTLIELLLAAALGVVVVSVAGLALLNILSASQAEATKSKADLDDNRTLSFIASEGKSSAKIIKDPSDTSAVGANARKCNLSDGSNAEPVVAFQMPDGIIPLSSSDTERRIVYCIADKNDPVWLGSKVIHRWGPKFDENGEYKDPGDLSEWKSAVVVDLVDETASPASPCPDTTNWTKIGSKGFYTCVNNDELTAEIYLNLKIPDNNEIYKGKVRIFALSTID